MWVSDLATMQPRSFWRDTRLNGRVEYSSYGGTSHHGIRIRLYAAFLMHLLYLILSSDNAMLSANLDHIYLYALFMAKPIQRYRDFSCKPQHLYEIKQFALDAQ